MNAGIPPAPGWYPDPLHPSRARWWDGSAWTASHLPLSGPDVYHPDVLIQTEVKRATRGMIAFGGYAVVVAASSAVNLLIAASNLNNLQATPVALAIASSALFFLEVLFAIGTMAYQYWALAFAADLGYPTPFAPYWAILGPIIPLADLVLPCLTMISALAPGNAPARKVVITTWCISIGLGILNSFRVLLTLEGVIVSAIVLAGTLVLIPLNILVVRAVRNDHVASINELAARTAPAGA